MFQFFQKPGLRIKAHRFWSGRQGGTGCGVFVGVLVAVLVGVFVGVLVGVFVGVSVGVLVGVSVGVLVGVSVADIYTIPANRLISKNLTDRTATVQIVEGNAAFF